MNGKRKRNRNILIKPVSGACNMQCEYCFYQDEMKHREVASYGKMSLETLEVLLEKFLAATSGDCVISFQGGEPTLAGLDFYRQAVELEHKYNIHGCSISNVIQTNGFLIDEEWADFFQKEKFLVGISLDGMGRIHDKYRKDTLGEGTFGRVMQAIDILKAHQVEFNILTVVTKESAKSIEKIYRFFKKQGLVYQQYIPCLESLGEDRGDNACVMSVAEYAEFLKRLFDCWYRDMITEDYVYVRYFENLAGMLKGCPPEQCALAGTCQEQWIIEADGSVYPCDFYVLDQWRLGSVWEQSVEELEEKRKESGFVEESELLMEECDTCAYYALCRGGCKRERIIEKGRGKAYYCHALKEFFAYSLERLYGLLN